MTATTALWLGRLAWLVVDTGPAGGAVESVAALAPGLDPLGALDVWTGPALVAGSVLISSALSCWILWVTCAGFTKLGLLTTTLMVVFTTGISEALSLSVNALSFPTAWLKL